MAAAPALYNSDVLGLATSLALFPWSAELPLQVDVRSRSCGSTLSVGLATDGDGAIAQIGLRSHACAIGQAAAAIFAKSAAGKRGAEVREALSGISDWLAGTGPMPSWPELDIIAAARDYPARHGAITLAWRAASDLLP